MTDEILPPEVEEADRAPASQSAPAPLPPAPTRSAPYGQSEGAPTLTEEDPNYAEHWNSGQSGSGLSPNPNKWDKFKEGVTESVQGSLLGDAFKKFQEKSVEEGTLVDPTHANQINPYRATPYTTPVDSGILKMEAADGYERQQRNEWLGRNDMNCSALCRQSRRRDDRRSHLYGGGPCHGGGCGFIPA